MYIIQIYQQNILYLDLGFNNSVIYFSSISPISLQIILYPILSEEFVDDINIVTDRLFYFYVIIINN